MYIVCKPFAQTQVRPKASSGHDMLITGTAIEHQLVLATGNVRDLMGCGVQVVNPFDGVLEENLYRARYRNCSFVNRRGS